MSFMEFGERNLDIVSFGEPTLFFLFAPLQEGNSVNQAALNATISHFQKQNMEALLIAQTLCMRYLVPESNTYQCGILNKVTSDHVFFIMPNEWNAATIVMGDNASLIPVADLINFFLESNFDGYLALSDRRCAPFIKDQGLYTVCIAVKIDDQDDHLKKFVSLADLEGGNSSLAGTVQSKSSPNPTPAKKRFSLFGKKK
ncbi:MAG: hypothetical protein ABFC56_12610 [Clostridiaceae bacterium]